MDRFMRPGWMAAAGLLLGAAAKAADICTSNLGNIFSQFPIWIMLGSLFAVLSPTRRAAAVNELCFGIAMLVSYYLVNLLANHEFYSSFVLGWTVFALFTPLMGIAVWQTRRPGWAGRVIAAGTAAVSLISSVVFFRGPRVYDFVITAAILWLLLIRAPKRGKEDG